MRIASSWMEVESLAITVGQGKRLHGGDLQIQKSPPGVSPRGTHTPEAGVDPRRSLIGACAALAQVFQAVSSQPSAREPLVDCNGAGQGGIDLAAARRRAMPAVAALSLKKRREMGLRIPESPIPAADQG